MPNRSQVSDSSMGRCEFLDAAELAALLYGESSLEQVSRISEHVECCEACQETITNMAATEVIWEKASVMITESANSSVFAIGGSPPSSSESAPHGALASDRDANSSNLLMFQIPSHPEMLGKIGTYDIEREIGRGGMGVVFKAHDPELNRPVAIKFLAPHLATNGAARKRFAQEARAVAAVLHPNVVSIHGVEHSGKSPYIVMPYVAGASVRSLVDENGPLDIEEIAKIARQVAAGLGAAHSQSVIHRDIKPANLLIENGVGRVVITDFGLARAGNDASLTQTGWFAGTPNFMSPEQAKGDRVDARSDLFSLGSVMYFMATGRLPFRADIPIAVLNRICNDQPTPVRQVNPAITADLAEIIEKLHSKAPENRVQSAGELQERLENYLAKLRQPELGTDSNRTKPKASIVSKRRTNFWKMVPFCIAGVLFIGAMVWLVLKPQEVQNSNINSVELTVTTKAIEALLDDNAIQSDAYVSATLEEMELEINEISVGLSALSSD